MKNCVLKDIDKLEEIALSAKDASKAQTRDEVEKELLESMTPQQKALWVDLEEMIVAEQVAVQEATVKALHCQHCNACGH